MLLVFFCCTFLRTCSAGILTNGRMADIVCCCSRAPTPQTMKRTSLLSVFLSSFLLCMSAALGQSGPAPSAAAAPPLSGMRTTQTEIAGAARALAHPGAHGITPLPSLRSLRRLCRFLSSRDHIWPDRCHILCGKDLPKRGHPIRNSRTSEDDARERIQCFLRRITQVGQRAGDGV